MANLQHLEQAAYSTLQDYFKVLSRQGWVNQASVNTVLVLLFATQFWWKYSVLMEEKDVKALQRLFRCIGINCLVPSLKSHMHNKVVINKRSYDADPMVFLRHEDANLAIMNEANTAYLIPEKS